ncbi:hypothetical protein UlMin_008649 [Ulmus minor]
MAGTHVLVYPYPSSGHIIPLLDLTDRLLTRGLTVTLLVTPKNLPLLQPLISTHSSSSLKPLVINVTEPPPSSSNKLIAAIRNLRQHHEPALIQWFKSHNPSTRPVAIISDFLLGWTNQLASKIGVRRVVFSPSGSFAQSIAFSLWQSLPKNENPEDANLPVSFSNVPNSPIYPWWQIVEIYRNGKEGDPDWEFYRSINLANMASWGVVFNSFAKLEGQYLNHLKKEVGHDRVWAVGPLLPVDDKTNGTINRGGSNSNVTQKVMTWLDSRENNSVVYVCFGSRATLTNAQIKVLTTALEHSRVQFILCSVGEIPNGYEDRVKDRGLVIREWAPQLVILRHRVVGSFLTHCGWNSVLEGLASRVVLLTWPMGADQFTNAKLLVNQLQVGIRVGEGTRVIPGSGELARLLVASLEESRPEKERVREIGDSAMEAVRGGSSEKDLDELVKRVDKLKEKERHVGN